MDQENPVNVHDRRVQYIQSLGSVRPVTIPKDRREHDGLRVGDGEFTAINLYDSIRKNAADAPLPYDIQF